MRGDLVVEIRNAAIRGDAGLLSRYVDERGLVLHPSLPSTKDAWRERTSAVAVAGRKLCRLAACGGRGLCCSGWSRRLLSYEIALIAVKAVKVDSRAALRNNERVHQ